MPATPPWLCDDAGALRRQLKEVSEAGDRVAGGGGWVVVLLSQLSYRVTATGRLQASPTSAQ